MDIRAKDILSKIQKLPGLEASVIAGGFVRDTILQGEKSDIDIFIPAYSFDEFNRLVYENRDFRALFEGQHLEIDQNDYGIRENYFGKVDATFGGLDVDIMGYGVAPESFGNDVVSKFTFGIQRVYFDGFTIIETEEFSYDVNTNQISLLKLEDIASLEFVFDKFKKIKAKYPYRDFHLRTPILSIRDQKVSDQSLRTIKYDWMPGPEWDEVNEVRDIWMNDQRPWNEVDNQLNPIPVLNNNF